MTTTHEGCRVAMLLAAHDPLDRSTDQEDVLRRGHVARDRFGWGRPSLLWTYSIGSPPQGLTSAEAKALLGVERKSGEQVVVTTGLFDFCNFLAALAVPGGAVARAAAIVGVPETEIKNALARAGLDLEKRTLGGVGWMDMALKHTWLNYRVVDEITDERQVLHRHAQALSPSLSLGDTFDFPVGNHELDAFLAYFPAPESAGWLDADGLMVHRRGGIRPELDVDERVLGPALSLVDDLPKPALQRLFVDEHSRAVVFRAPAGSILDVLSRGRGLHADSGWWPIVVGTDEQLMNLREARAIHGPRPTEEVLEAAQRVNLARFREERRDADPDYYDASSHRGSWPSSTNELVLEGRWTEATWIALIPVAKAWQVPAHLQSWHNELPPAEVLVAIAKRWAEDFDAQLVAQCADEVLFQRAAPCSSTQQELTTLAEEIFYYCADTVHQDFRTIENLAAFLGQSRVWRLWWD